MKTGGKGKLNESEGKSGKKMVWYHTIELTPDFTTDGIYDWRPYWNKFNFGDLHGKTVLDVGAGDGFFSFEFEKRGAKVTALDIPDQGDADSSKMGTRREWTPETIERGQSIIDFKTKFGIAKGLLKSSVERVEINLYDMSKENIGLFDIVFCGDTLLHLTDPVRAITRMRNVCKERVIIATPIYPTLLFSLYTPLRGLRELMAMALENLSLGYFVGADNKGAFWFPTKKCLSNIVIAGGFSREKWITSFKMSKKHSKVTIGVRGIVHGYV